MGLNVAAVFLLRVIAHYVPAKFEPCQQHAAIFRSMAESYAPPDWKKALTGRQFERSGMQAYGAAKLFNIMLAKEYSKRLKVNVYALRCSPQPRLLPGVALLQATAQIHSLITGLHSQPAIAEQQQVFAVKLY